MIFYMSYKLTEEGERYLKEGLPEKNLLNVLKKGKISISQAQKQVGNFDIAFMWAKKKLFVEVKKGELIILKEPKEFPEEEALKKISEGKQIDEKLLDTLLQRKLVKKVIIGEADKLIGKEVGDLTPDLIKTGLWKKVKLKQYDVDLVVPKISPGKIHPYRQVIDDIRERLIGLGFVEERGPLVEIGFWNSEALFMPADHPARSIHDIFFVKEPKFGAIKDKELWKRVQSTHEKGWITGSKGWGIWSDDAAKRLILRSHGTAVSARSVHKYKDLKNHKSFTIDRVFRPDVIDAKHLIEFDQLDGIVISEDLNFRNLLGFLKEIMLAMGADDVKFKPTYFPFTEPSVEGYAFIKGLGWAEIGGAGIFRPEVTMPLGVDKPVLAWGLGIGRLAMIKMGISDVRYIYSDNIQWLRDKEVVV